MAVDELVGLKTFKCCLLSFMTVLALDLHNAIQTNGPEGCCQDLKHVQGNSYPFWGNSSPGTI